jgi:hypothetical protein
MVSIKELDGNVCLGSCQGIDGRPSQISTVGQDSRGQLAVAGPDIEH